MQQIKVKKYPGFQYLQSINETNKLVVFVLVGRLYNQLQL